MSRRNRRLLKLGIFATVLFVLYMLFWPYGWRQKVSIVVNTPTGELSAGSVTKVNWHKTYKILPDGPDWSNSVSGEASVLDLGEGRYIFALLRGMDRLALESFAGEWDRLTPLSDRFAYIRSFDGTKVLAKEHYPLLVTFDDINDPASVREVDPDDLDASFGCSEEARKAAGLTGTEKCYSLKSITLEITDEPVTEGEVQKLLGWLGLHPEPGLCPATGRSTNIPDCRKVKHGSFKRN